MPSVPTALLTDGTVGGLEVWFRAVGCERGCFRVCLMSGCVVGARQEWKEAVPGWEGGLRQYCCGLREGTQAFAGCTPATWQSRIKIPVSK